MQTAVWYARPQITFGDGVWNRCILEVHVDKNKILKQRKKGGDQWIFHTEDIKIFGVWIFANSPPGAGDERLGEWMPELEVLPAGRQRVQHKTHFFKFVLSSQ